MKPLVGLLLTAVALAAMLIAGHAHAASVNFRAGQSISFRNPYKTGCITLEAAEVVFHMATGRPANESAFKDCFELIPDKSYQIVEVQRFNGNDFYRIALSNGTLVWTYILSSRDVHEAFSIGSRIVLHAPNYGCANIDTMIQVASSRDPIIAGNIVARHRGLINDVCDNLPAGIDLEVEKIVEHSRFRLACVAKYVPNIAAGPNRPCMWTVLE
jgi:hypothetical protein